MTAGWAEGDDDASFALLIPYIAIGRTLLYFDLRQRPRGTGEALARTATLAP